MSSHQLDLIIFTLGSMIGTIIWSALLLILGWHGFLAFMTLFSAACTLGAGIHLIRTTGK